MKIFGFKEKRKKIGMKTFRNVIANAVIGIVGTAALDARNILEIRCWAGGQMEMKCVFVKGWYRRHGYGSNIVEALETLAKYKGFDKWISETVPSYFRTRAVCLLCFQANGQLWTTRKCG